MDVIKELVKDAEKVMKSQARGDNWCRKVVPVLVGVSNAKKVIEGEKKEATGKLKAQVKALDAPFKLQLDALAEIDEPLRARVKEEHGGTDTVCVDEVGELSFHYLWGYEVEVLGIVPEEYLTVDKTKVMEAIKEGVREIDGLVIGQTRRVLTVRKATGTGE